MNKQFALPGILLFLIGSVVGAAGHILLAAETRTPAQEIKPSMATTLASTPGTAAPNELAQAMRELTAVLASMEPSLELRNVERARASIPENTRTELAPQFASDPSLAKAINALSAAIAGMPSNGSNPASSSINMLAHSNWVNRRDAFASDTLFLAYISKEDGAWERAEAAHLQKHMFWSYQDMLEAYGRPDGIETNGDMVEWFYNVTLRDGFQEYYAFSFHDGLMVSANYDREEP